MSNSLQGNPSKVDIISARIHFSLNTLIRNYPSQKIGTDFLQYAIGSLFSYCIHYLTSKQSIPMTVGFGKAPGFFSGAFLLK